MNLWLASLADDERERDVVSFEIGKCGSYSRMCVRLSSEQGNAEKRDLGPCKGREKRSR